MSILNRPQLILTATEEYTEDFKCGSSAKHTEIALGVYGEYPHVTTKQIASRQTCAMTTNVSVTANAAYSVNYTIPDAIVFPNNGIGTTGGTYDNPNLLGWIGMAYLGFRGSKVYTIDSGADSQIMTRAPTRAYRIMGGSYTANISITTVQPSTSVYVYSAYGVVAGNANPYAEFVVPQYYNGYFKPTFPMASSNAGGNAITATNANVLLVEATNPSGSPYTAVACSVLASCGDDGQFVFFTGCPPLAYPGTT